MVIDHIGIVVKSIPKALQHWQDVFGYLQTTEIVINTRQRVKVVFLEKPGSTNIKLVEPTGPTSNVYVFAQKGGGLHHLCFKCDDLQTELNALTKKGLRLIVPPEPGEAFENEKIAFVYAKHGMNIEIVDTDKRAKRIESDAPVP